jgi:RNA polymerase sigma-70 factor (ECF subfamily)
VIPARPRPPAIPQVAVTPSPGPEPTDWLEALAVPGGQRDDAVRRLHQLMVKAARHQVWRMRDMLHGHGPDVVDDIANAAADKALTTLLSKLDTFEGRSRFTTWAYKFAILEAATEVSRQAWANREVHLDDWDLRPQVTATTPEEHAEASDLAAAVARAMQTTLTPYQRKVAVALLVDGVPIDVLADRLGTTRGALYKALHQARTRLRASLEATGYLPGHIHGDAR